MKNKSKKQVENINNGDDKLLLSDVMPSSCIFNGERRAIRDQSEHFYYFHVGRWKWNYAEKHLCTDLQY